MNIDFFLFADAASQTKENKAVLHGIFDTIFVKQIPAQHPSMVACFQVNGSEVTAGVPITFKLRDVLQEKDILEQTIIVTQEVDDGIFKGFLNIIGLPIENIGIIRGELWCKGNKVASADLKIRKLE